MFKKRKKQDKKYLPLIISILLVFIILLITVFVRDDRSLTYPEKIIKDTVFGIQNIVSYPFKKIGEQISIFNNSKKINKEYIELKNKEEAINLTESLNLEQKKTIEELKSMLELKQTLVDYSIINSTIINRDMYGFYNYITINRGENDGVSINTPVVTNAGLIGKVIKVSKTTSTVKLITNNDSYEKISVGIDVNNTRVHGLITEYDSNTNLLKIEGISGYNEIDVNSKVYTTGLGEIFPSGILVGEVFSVSKDEYDLSYIIKVKPSVDFNDIRFVSVIMRQND